MQGRGTMAELLPVGGGWMWQRLKFFSTRDWAASRFLEIEAKFGKIEAKFLDISDMASRAENGLIPPGLRPFCHLRRKQKGGPKEKHRHSQGEEMKIDDAADLFDVIDGRWL
eukprot:scaffold112450_cov41-Cyclotella_meneghiniana.AAC.1